MRHPLGAERERARRQREGCVGNPEGQLTLEDVEPLVLLGVDVPRRPHAGGHDDLEQPVLASRVVPADLDRLQHSEQPVRLPFVLAKHVAVLGTLCRNDGHLTTPFRSETAIIRNSL